VKTLKITREERGEGSKLESRETIEQGETERTERKEQRKQREDRKERVRSCETRDTALHKDCTNESLFYRRRGRMGEGSTAIHRTVKERSIS
jgi:hypothetical protein